MTMKKLLTGLLFALWFAVPAHAQTARVVPTCSTLPQAYAPGATRDITQDVNGNTCIAGSFSATGGTISNATSGQATTTTNQGAVSYLYGFNGTTWDQLQVDASKFLKINCVAGCAGGTFNNNADAVATSATNGQAAAWLYGFNGTTYDRLRADTTNGLWVNVKADATAASLLSAVQAATPAGTNRIGYVSDDPCTQKTKTNLPISQNGTSSVQLVALSGSTVIYVCSLSLIAAGATTVALTTGTGTACVTGNAAVIGSTTANIANSLSLAANGGLTMGSGNGSVALGAASSELCMVLGTNVFVSGNLTYVQQ